MPSDLDLLSATGAWQLSSVRSQLDSQYDYYEHFFRHFTVSSHLLTTAVISILLTHPVICISLLVYDYFLTLERELRCFWSGSLLKSWTPVKVLFVLQRYLPFVDTGILTVQGESFYTHSGLS